MLQENDKQWLENNDILEGYIFNRLTPEDKSRLESLLDAEPEVQRELDMTAMIIAAVRQKERAELKERIRAKLNAGSSAKILTMDNRPSAVSLTQKVIRFAAAIALLAGGTWVIYHLYTSQHDKAPVTKDDLKTIESPKQQKPVFLPKEEKISEFKEKTDTPKSNGKIRKTLSDKKPALVSVPAETVHVKAGQKFVVNPLLFPKANEVKVPLITADNKDTETRIIFKNPIDLSAVNIQQTSADTAGTLLWFYVYYENQVLNVYLDNSKYLTAFKNARILEQKDQLTLQLEKSRYTVDLKPSDKFKKAVIAQ